MKKLLLLSSLFFSVQLLAQDSIYKQDIIAASKLVDIKFTEAEIDSMYDDIRETQLEYIKMHSAHLDNSIPMSLWQNPLLPGMKLNEKQLPVQWNIPQNISLPANRNELAFYSVSQLASLIKNKKISSVELTLFFIDRLKKYADTLQCVISLTEDIALQQAKAADSLLKKGIYLGPLHGIPYGLKDLFAVKGTKTTWGAAPYKEQRIETDAFVYQQLKKAGAVLVAKFTLGALAMGDNWYGGITKNPWNLKQGSSGSSAGSASATVAGLVPFAIGTETWGSIISPSTRCGATGLRPTFGSVSRSGAMTLSWSLDKAGPICRSADDAAIVFYYIKGTDGIDQSARNAAFNYTKADPRKIKIGYAKNYFDKLDSAAPERKVLEVYKSMGVNLIPMNFPDSGVYNFSIMSIVIGGEDAAAFDEFTRNNIDDQMTRQTKDDWPNVFRGRRFIPAVEYINANRHRYLLMQKVNEAMKDFDAVIVPTFRSGNQTAITNLTGHPAICFPIGFNRAGSPVSITILGNLYEDAKICAAAKLYQDATDWENQHPPLFK